MNAFSMVFWNIFWKGYYTLIKISLHNLIYLDMSVICFCSSRNCPIGKYWSVKRGIGENLVTQLIVSKKPVSVGWCIRSYFFYKVVKDWSPAIVSRNKWNDAKMLFPTHKNLKFRPINIRLKSLFRTKLDITLCTAVFNDELLE